MTDDKKPRMTTEEILADYNNLPVDISEVEWVLADAYAALQKENEELKRLKDELSTAGQRGVDELAKENASLRESLKDAVGFIEGLASQELDDSDLESMPENEAETILNARHFLDKIKATMGEG